MVSHSNLFLNVMKKTIEDHCLPEAVEEKIKAAVEYADNTYSIIEAGDLENEDTCSDIIASLGNANSIFRSLMAVQEGINIYGLSHTQQAKLSYAFQAFALDVKAYLLEKHEKEENEAWEKYHEKNIPTWIGDLTFGALGSTAKYVTSYFSSSSKTSFDDALRSTDIIIGSFENPYSNVEAALKAVRDLEEEESSLQEKLIQSASFELDLDIDMAQSQGLVIEANESSTQGSSLLDLSLSQAQSRLDEIQSELGDIKSIQQIAAPIRAKLEELCSGDEGSFENIRAILFEAVVDEVRDQSSRLIEDIQDAVSTSAQSASEIANSAISGAQEMALAVGERIAETVSDLQKEVTRCSEEALGQLQKMALPLIQSASETLIDGLQDVVKQGVNLSVDSYIVPKIDPNKIYPKGFSQFFKNYVWYWLPVEKTTQYDGGIIVEPSLKGKIFKTLDFGQKRQEEITRTIQSNLQTVLEPGVNSRRMGCVATRALNQVLLAVNALTDQSTPEDFLREMGIKANSLEEYKKKVNAKAAGNISVIATTSDFESIALFAVITRAIESFKAYISRVVIYFALARSYPVLSILVGLAKNDESSKADLGDGRNILIKEFLKKTGVSDILNTFDKYGDVVCYYILDEFFSEMAQIIKDERRGIEGKDPWKDETLMSQDVEKFRANLVGFRKKLLKHQGLVSGVRTSQTAIEAVGNVSKSLLLNLLDQLVSPVDLLLDNQLTGRSFDVMTPAIDRVMPLYREWIGR